MSLQHLMFVLLVSCIFGCGGNSTLENSTVRYQLKTIDFDVEKNLTMELNPLLTREDCGSLLGSDPSKFVPSEFETYEAQMQACMPMVNRSTGEISLSFALTNLNQGLRTPLRLPLDSAGVELIHSSSKKGYQNRVISGADKDEMEWSFEPHDPRTAGQLYIVLVDHSGSMRELAKNRKTGVEKTRMEWVRLALKKAQKTLLAPEGVDSAGQTVPASAVALFRFGGSPGGPDKLRIEGFDGQRWDKVVPITSGSAYKKALKSLENPRFLGWTHLYDAVELTTTQLLDSKNKSVISKFLERYRDVSPTVIVLTDGFNNVDNNDTCASNAGRLSELLDTVKKARIDGGSAVQPLTIYTVGFGQPMDVPNPPVQDNTTVSDLELCGKYSDVYISGDLENDFIDGRSLEKIAQFGGGKAFLDADPSKLEQAFKEAAPARYSWYTYKYKLKSTELRERFATTIRMVRFGVGEATVKWYPSPWIDGPTPIESETTTANGDTGYWSRPRSIRHATGLAVLLFGGLLCLTFLGPALFNARRAVTRRSRKTS